MYLRDIVETGCTLAFRFFTGRCLDGKRRTNASFFHEGTKVNTPTGRASRWAHLPGYQRAAWRSVGLAIFLATSWGLIVAYEATMLTWRISLGLGIIPGLCVGIERGREWSHRKKILALGKAIADSAGHSTESDVFRWIDAPLGYKSDPDKEITVTMGETYSARDHARASLARQSARKLGLKDEYEERWLDEERTRMIIRAKPEPPKLVTFDDIQLEFEKTADTELVIGAGSRKKIRRISLDSDSPHVLASIGSGGGKSEFGKSVALQGLRKGFRIVIIDIVKRGSSHKWAKGIPGIEIYRHPDVAHDVLLEIQEQVEQRCENYFHRGSHDPSDQRVFLIIEESNQTIRRLNSYWRNVLEGQRTSPAVLAIESILCVGREALFNVFTVGQRMSAAASGGGDARENYGIRLGNRFSKQTLQMLFDTTDAKPKSSNHPGRVAIVTATTSESAQVPLLDPDIAIPWAQAGVPQPGSASRFDSAHQAVRRLALVPAGSDTGASDTVSSSGETPDQTNAAPVDLTQLRYLDDPEVGGTADQLIGLREAVALGIVPCTLAVLKNGRARDPEFPLRKDTRGSRPNGESLYDPRDLVKWERNRSARRENDGDGAS